MNRLKMLNDSFYEESAYYYDFGDLLTPNLSVANSSSSSLHSTYLNSSSLQPDTSTTSTFLSLPLRPVQSSSPNFKNPPSPQNKFRPHVLSETLTNSSSSSSSCDNSPPNSSPSDPRSSTTCSLSSHSRTSSLLSPPFPKGAKLGTRNVTVRCRCCKDRGTRNRDYSFTSSQKPNNNLPLPSWNNNQGRRHTKNRLLPFLPSLSDISTIRKQEILQLIERTKQRKERLQKLSDIDFTVRKRRPLKEDNSVQIDPPLDDESPKRQCLREDEQNIKPDTPAIRSVRSRQNELTKTKSYDLENDEYIPVPVPRKSLSHEENHDPEVKPERRSRFARLAQTINSWEDDYSYHTIKGNENEDPAISRDSSSSRTKLTAPIVPPLHSSAPTRSRSPAPIAPSSPCQSRSPGRSRSPAPIAPGSPGRSRSPAPIAPGSPGRSRSPAPIAPGSPSQSRSPAPIAPGSPGRSRSPAPIAPGSPGRSRSPAPIAFGSAYRPRSPAPISLGSASRSKSPAPSQIRNINEIDDLEAVVNRMSQQSKAMSTRNFSKSAPSCDPIQGVSSQVPINSQGLNESSSGEVTDDEPTNKSVSERLAKWNKKVSETDLQLDSAAPSSPVASTSGSPRKSGVQNLSTRLAMLEKNITTSPVKSNKPVTVAAAPPAVSFPSKQEASSVCSQTQSSAQNPVVMRVKEKKTRRESFEPTRESVSKRMADWQKKVSAVENTKEKEPTAYPVNARMSAWEKVTASGGTQANKMIKPQGDILPPPASRPPSTSMGKPLIPKSPVANRKVDTSPAKSYDIGGATAAKTLSPAKASCAMKAIQQRLFESQSQNTTCSLAEKIRQERMAELKVIENRWQNGLLKEHCVTNSDFETDDEKQTSNKPCPLPPSSGIPPPPPLPPSTTDFLHPPPPPPIKKSASVPVPADPPSTTMGFASAGPTSIFKLIASSQSSSIKKTSNSVAAKNVVKQVRFEDSFESSDDSVENGVGVSPSDDFSSDNEAEKTLEARHELRLSPEDEEEGDYMYSSEEENEALAAQAANIASARPTSCIDSESDDVSISAFVSDVVRQQRKVSLQTESCSNILALAHKQQQQQQQQQILDADNSSFESQDEEPIAQYTTDDSDSEEGASVDDALDEALEMDTDDADMERTPTNQYSANKRGSHNLATCTDSCYDDSTTTDDDVVMRNRSPLVYSISMYRSKRFSNNVTPVQKIVRNSRPMSSEEDLESDSVSDPPPEDDRKSILTRIKALNNQVSLEQTVILQTSNALNQCCTEGSTFNGSAEQVECHKLLLIACQKRRAYLTEIQRLKDTNRLDHLGHGTRGTLTISDIRLPLKKDFVSKMTTAHDLSEFYYVILIRNGPQVFVTQLMKTHDRMVRGSLDFPDMIKINSVTAKFEVSLEIYEMKLLKEKYKDKKKKSKKCKGLPSTPVSTYPSGLSDIHTSSFSLTGSVVLTMKTIDKTSFTMHRVPYESPLIGTIHLRTKCMMETNVSERGFLTMFEDVSGLGAWHRRWCVLNGNKLKYWKYPDDESRKDPIGYIDLKRCITEKVGLISRDVCARPNTFEMCTVRPLRPGEEDTLTTRKHTTMATVRHMLSADTREDRVLWCNKVNQALDNIRAWQPDALRPVRMANQPM